MEFEIVTFREPSHELLDILEALEIAIFEQPYAREKLSKELARKQNLIALIAKTAENPVGFKVGFEMTTTLFYSWIGGVIPEYRKHGIAARLMKQQHQLAEEAGFSVSVRMNWNREPI